MTNNGKNTDIEVKDDAFDMDNGADEKVTNPSHLDILVGLVKESGIEFFHAPNGVAYADIHVDGHRQTWALRSDGFQHWCQRKFFERTSKALKPKTFREGLEEFEMNARFKGQKREVYMRRANLGGTIYIDLCNSKWEAIEADTTGWRIVDAPPARFIRAPGTKPLPYPDDSGDINFLYNLLNISPEKFPLPLFWILYAIYNHKNFPVMIVNGCAGSSKSTFTTIIRSIIDPNEAPILMFPEKQDDILADANYSHIVAYDNISRVSSKISDTLSQIATGAYVSGRKGISKQKQFLSSLTSPTILNGIEFSTKEDLSDRAIFIELDPIAKEDRRSHSELMEAFEAAHPRILGALMNGLVEGLRNIKKVDKQRLPYLPRMSEFARFSAAAETAFFERGTFERAYSHNIDMAAQDIIEDDPLASTLRPFLNKQPRKAWEGTPTSLFDALTPPFGRRIRGFPSTPAKLGARLRRLATPLTEAGVHVEFDRTERNQKRIIRISVNDESPDAPTPSGSIMPFPNGHDTGADHSSSVGFRSAIEGNLAVVVSGDSLEESKESLQTAPKNNKQVNLIRIDEIISELGITCASSNDNLPSIISYRSGDAINIQPGNLYHGDNLAILKHVGTATVDLIATDPPFNTGRKQQGTSGASFPDRWRWENVREEWLEDIARIEGLRDYIDYVQKIDSSMAAFLCFMAVRLIEMKRVLKDTGSIYLHCDPTASHYLKELMDAILGKENFINEIVWCYSNSGRAKTGFASKHDIILFYAKNKKVMFWNDYRIPISEKYLNSMYRQTDSEGNRCRIRVDAGKERIYYPDAGMTCNDWWDDIPSLSSKAGERTGYPTQKPAALYERIIEASSNPGDIVLDPFMGSGTTLVAAENLERDWLGIDFSQEACEIAGKRLGKHSLPTDNQTLLLPDKRNLPAIIPYQPGNSISIDPGTLYNGDNLLILREIGTETIDLIATDPPFNTDKIWFGKAGSFDDRFNNMDEYVGWMQERVVEMHRILKATGSIYLHCDSTASHYLKVMMDEVFGRNNFRNDISWCYTGPANVNRHFPRKHDNILFYSKSKESVFNKDAVRIPYKELSGGKDGVGGGEIWSGGHDMDRINELRVLGKVPESYWTDINSVTRQHSEKSGYPTQKPVKLYKRIIEASSNPGDIILDPFCGSGTTLIAAETLGRKWIGIDNSKDACETTQRRFNNIEETDRNGGGAEVPAQTSDDNEISTRHGNGTVPKEAVKSFEKLGASFTLAGDVFSIKMPIHSNYKEINYD